MIPYQLPLEGFGTPPPKDHILTEIAKTLLAREIKRYQVRDLIDPLVADRARRAAEEAFVAWLTVEIRAATDVFDAGK